MSKRWHVTCEAMFWDGVAPGHRERLKPQAVWTLSLTADETGWETDGSADGYGLTWAHATELADAANGVTP